MSGCTTRVSRPRCGSRVAGVFLGTYVVVFVLRFVLLERLFGRLGEHEAAADRSADQAS
jgi:hypothetical protein